MKPLIVKQLKSKHYVLIILTILLPLLSHAQSDDKEKTNQIPVTQSGSMLINQEVYFYATSSEGTKYYNRFGQEVNTKGEIISTKLSAQPKKSKTSELDSDSNSGEILINDKVYYYFKSNGTTKYYDQKGNEVDKNGKPKTVIKL